MQLSNAGGFSVIHNQQAIGSIVGLIKFYDHVKFNGEDYLADFKTVATLAPKMLKIIAYPSNILDPIFYSMPHQTEFFTRYDKPLLEELYSWIRIEKGKLELYNQEIQAYKRTAIKLIHFLQQEYHFETQ